jgi:putative transposase
VARLARIIVPGYPHHVTQRGNRRQKTFFCEDDYRHYVALIGKWCRRRNVEIWAYCLMPNHVHLIALPSSQDGLRRAIGEAHRRYSLAVNTREGWRGHLWQGRFNSFVLDEPHLLAAARYIELNPVRAGLAPQPDGYRWSSAAAHLTGQDDNLVRVDPLLSIVEDWRAFLSVPVPSSEAETLRRHERTGRPLGSEAFVTKLEGEVGRRLHPQKGGRPRKPEN